MKPYFFYILFTLIIVSCKESKQKNVAEAALAGKKIELSTTAGWQLDDQYTISQPSNIISNNGYSYVFYVKEPKNSPLAGSGYGGTIHYAFSRDQGHTWSDQGLLINKGIGGGFDAGGVSKPTVIKVTDEDFFYLYYVGVGDQFNNLDGTEVNKTSIGLSKLLFNPDGPIRLAIKLNSGAPVIAADSAGMGFDAFRVDDPKVINMNGQSWIYYTGIDKFGGVSRTGLVVSADVNVSHVKQNNHRALLDGVPSIVQKQDIGVLAIFSDTQNAWYAEDGIHYIKLKNKFPSQIKGARANGDTQALTWGLAEPLNKTSGFGRWEIK